MHAMYLTAPLHCLCTILPTGYYWGLGGGNWQDSVAPVNVSGDHEFTHVAAGSVHTCALDTSGHAWCWGAY